MIQRDTADAAPLRSQSAVEQASAEHSPTPWELVEATEHHGPYICNLYGGDVCDLYAMSNPMAASIRNGGTSFPVQFRDAAANAAFIVKAVNSHEEMVEALKQSRDRLLWIQDVRDGKTTGLPQVDACIKHIDSILTSIRAAP